MSAAVGRHVFMRDPGSEFTLAHELVHVRQQAEHPIWRWNPWRMRWEAEAYAVQVREGTPVESVARMIAGPMYGWCCRPGDRRWLDPAQSPSTVLDPDDD